MRCKIDGNDMRPLVKDLEVCEVCSLVSSTIRPAKEIYDKSYVMKYERYGRTAIGEAIQKYRMGAVRKMVKGPAKVLDYGCGVGTFVEHAAKCWVDVSGFDINPWSKYCDPSVLFDTYDVVTLWDVLEHIEDPVGFLGKLRTKYVAICTPCLDDWPGEFTEIPKWRHYMPEEHVHYFTEHSLTALLKASGYKVSFVDFGESEFRTGGGAKNIITVGGEKNG